LKEYLKSRENAIHGLEVVTIMMSLFDKEEILKSYIASERKEAADEAAKRAAMERNIEIAKNLMIIMKDKMSIGEISAATGLTEETVRSLKEEIMQLA
jgi:hypothetical protein